MKLYEINNKKEYDFSCIYLWTNLVNGKRYVGQTTCFYRRMKSYRCVYPNAYMKHAVKKYGIDNFDITILEYDVPLDRLDEREQYWLDYYQSYDMDKGYNICKVAGTTKGVTHTEEWCKKHSDWLKEKWKDVDYRQSWVDRMSGENNYFYGKHFCGELNPMYGKHHSQQTKDKMSRIIGKPVRCVETGDVYTSITKAAQAVGVTRCVVSEALRKGYRAGGYHWEFI